MPNKTPKEYQNLLHRITSIYTDGQVAAVRSVQRTLLLTYWQIGQIMVEFEQGGQLRADYGTQLLPRLSRDLSHQLGKGFNRSNLIYMRLLYLKYPKSAILSHQLTWAHYMELVKIDHDLERSFYEKQAIVERWTVRELKRQKRSSLFLRLAASRDKEGILELARRGHVIEKPVDVLRDPYVFEFLKLPESTDQRLHSVSEKDLEARLLDHLQTFLLELGKGFTFVGRQYRITLNNTHYKVDLVFYHRLLRCFVLIDLKVNDLRHADIGQMNMYMGYFAEEENAEGDNPPIGIILTREKDDLLVKYATYGMDSQLFVAKYQLYLPDAEQLRQTLEAVLE
ncbi:MAG TPA: hypothetical protein DCR35_06770 [Runella sp.]|nr:hypothetical protein [Runella sp.]HAO49012.1 hypothetical protein [Runella sp.]